MRQQPMVAHSDAKTSGNPPQHHREQECLPTEEEECSHGADVKYRHEEGGNPHDGLPERPIAIKESCQHISLPFI
jgi:hypothetical protein